VAVAAVRAVALVLLIVVVFAVVVMGFVLVSVPKHRWTPTWGADVAKETQNDKERGWAHHTC
jgi:hypothetical protein